MREKAGFYEDEESEEDENMKFIRETAKKIRVKKKLLSVSFICHLLFFKDFKQNPVLEFRTSRG